MSRRRWPTFSLLLWSLLLGCLGALEQSAWAHGMRTGYLELTESRTSEVQLHWRAPDSAAGAGAPLALELPAGCRELAAGGRTATLPPASISLPAQSSRNFQLHCPGSLAGAALRLSGLGPQLSEVVALATLSDGAVVSHLFTAAAPGWRLRGEPGRRRVAFEYILLGLRHILWGADHLLFLLLLVLAVRRLRGILLAETAFTISHSLSFCATALGWVQVSAAAAEACIALSLLLLALDTERPEVPLLSPWRATTLALVFGLVHGLGFAGGLQEVGIPEQAAAWALLGFGIGVELGQVAFLLLLVGVLRLLGGSRLLRPVALGATFAAGGLACYWLIERTLLLGLGSPGLLGS